MSVKYFVDTHILVYARDSTEPEKQPIAKQWLAHLWEQECGRISAQVLNEYYVTVTQKLKQGLSKEQARSAIRALAVWQPLEISSTLIESSWDIQDQYGYSWWDTLIITSALFLDCRYLLSEDMQHQQKISNLTIINPFLVTWNELE
ncbi:twitching motility protein PilT [Methyloprofundus sedimenti]|uniref:Twitching motility protein PilT n=1 Tax=Methyloprofundus sedimenti TaxID=1420851 RepID=A0A1V8M4E1_9GAMM|nr:PIN domain-containing protein [Methyloprofundus sedimenti]OQK16430.1 twitching motility protein PilT [Methyloprofundus sedimenti]